MQISACDNYTVIAEKKFSLPFEINEKTSEEGSLVNARRVDWPIEITWPSLSYITVVTGFYKHSHTKTLLIHALILYYSTTLTANKKC